MKYGVLIPAYEPDGRLTELAEALLKLRVETVVVDDGSASGQEIFARLVEMGVPVLHHEVNRGKGRALKTGIAYMAQRGYDGLVTADADGQHTPADILKVAQQMEQSPGQLVLGVRDIAQMVPRSKAGNTLTRFLFRLLYRLDIQDTQTGLRGIPLAGGALSALLELRGERYEYEMEMMIRARAIWPAGICQIPVETLYYDDNAASHFRPLQDGAKIYTVLFHNLSGFMVSSLCAFGLDYLLFNLFYYRLGGRTVPATVAARLFSGTFNFTVNKYLVFTQRGERYTLWNYVKLAVVILLLNSAMMYLLVDLLHLPAFFCKLLVEGCLYTVSFLLQNRLAHT